MKILKNKKGVSLAEVMAVIIIMGIIAAIAIPAIGGMIKGAKQKAVQSEAVTLFNVSKLYCVETTCPSLGIVTEQELITAGYLDSKLSTGTAAINTDTEGGVLNVVLTPTDTSLTTVTYDGIS